MSQDPATAITLEGITQTDISRFLAEVYSGVRCKDISPELTYYLEEAGVHYIIDNMDIDSKLKGTAKMLLSKRICIDQALETGELPINYYRMILTETAWAYDNSDSEQLGSYSSEEGIVPIMILKPEEITEEYRLKPFFIGPDDEYIDVNDNDDIRTILKDMSNRTVRGLKAILNSAEKEEQLIMGCHFIHHYIFDELNPDTRKEVFIN